MLISTASLAQRLSDPNVVVFDCRHDLGQPEAGRAWYEAGHVPGARFAGVDTDLSIPPDGRNGRHPLPSPHAFAVFLAAAGVTAQSTIVAYDQVGGQYAARLWWMARWIGHPQVAVLDGGWQKWNAESRPLETVIPVGIPGNLTPWPDDTRWVDAATVQAGAGLVVDARAPERYRGEVEPLDPVAGHIPGAVNHCYNLNLNADLTFRAPDELRAAWQGVLAGRDPAEVIHQCGSGITACVNLLAMELAGLGGSRLYAGSWSEWVADPTRPVATGAE